MAQVVWFLVFNIAAISLFATMHGFSAEADLLSSLPYQSYVCLVLIEAVVLFSPCFVALLASLTRFRRSALRVAVGIVLAISLIYLVDLGIYVTLREHLLSRVFGRFLFTVGPFLHAYLLPVHWLSLAGVLLAWSVFQILAWKLSGYLANRESSRNHDTEESSKTLPLRHAIPLMLVGAAPFVLAIWPAFSQWDQSLLEMQRYSDRHPIAATGLFAANSVPSFQEGSVAAMRGTSLMLQNAGAREQLISDYQSLKVSRKTSDAKLPDIAIVVSECFRADVLSPKTTPNLFKQAQQGLWLREHYSVGNASNLSFFGIMFGLEGHLFDAAAEMPVGLFSGLKQLGYQTGFFGRDDFQFFQMETFCHPSRFDVSRFLEPHENTTTDIIAIEQARQFFDREGPYADQSDQPRVAIIYVYAPHNWYHEKADEVHTSDDAAALLPTGLTNSHENFARFLNSIHFMDRAIEPLLDQDRIVVVTGDHGESFGEDGRSMHGSALSKVQLHVGMVAAGPGIPERKVDQRTSHTDIYPTLLDAIGAAVDKPQVLAGQSALAEIPVDRKIACRSMASAGNLFLPSVAAAPSVAEVAEKAFGYLGFFQWHDYTLAPGGWVDQFAESVPFESSKSTETQTEKTWQNAEPFRMWLRQRLGESFADIPTEIEPVLRLSLESDEGAVVLKSIQMVAALPNQGADGFREELRSLLASPDAAVRSSAFNLLHRLSSVE